MFVFQVMLKPQTVELGGIKYTIDKKNAMDVLDRAVRP